MQDLGQVDTTPKEPLMTLIPTRPLRPPHQAEPTIGMVVL